MFREGDAADALYIVSRGTLRIMSGIAVYEVVEAGGIVGEMAIVEEDKPRSASVISSTYAELIKVDRPTFREMVSDCSRFCADGNARDGPSPEDHEPALPTASRCVVIRSSSRGAGGPGTVDPLDSF